MIKLMHQGCFCRPLFLSFYILTITANVCLAQIADNFNDGDYTLNPIWTPDIQANWIIENGQLRSNSNTANSSFYISTPSAFATNSQWDFLINLKFNTSSANYVDLFLVSDRPDLTSPGVNGYFVRIGGTLDEVSLYKTVSGVNNILINGTDGVTNNSNNILRIKVIRIDDEWSLSIAPTGDANYQLEGSVNDGAFNASSFMGFRVTQSTSSFFGKHFFDDVYAGPIIVDETPPAILSVKVINSTELEIVFDEEIDPQSAQQSFNYEINHDIGAPLNISLSDNKTVHLALATPMVNFHTYTVTINGVKDLKGNSIANGKTEFQFFEFVTANFKDIIITELFPDPSPVIGLPEAEFIELYNLSDYVFDLNGWKLTDGSSMAKLPPYLLFPGEYVIVTAQSLVNTFSAFGSVAGVANFPTLNNSGDNIELISPGEILIDRVSYKDSWYHDEDKRQGGWTLELIDRENICAEEDNWTASENEEGGTPGKPNSVLANKPDLTGPKLISAIPISDAEILLTFNEKLEVLVPKLETVSVTEREITNIDFASTSLNQLIVKVTPALLSGEIYTLTVSEIYDCPGNEIQPEFSSAKLGLPAQASEGDVFINEILFNPKPFGVDFVEFYNASEKFINLNHWQISNYEDEAITNPKEIADHDILIFPHQYLVLTTDAETLKANYPNTIEENVIEVKSLPAFNDDEGTVAIETGEGLVLDHFYYNEDFHSQLLKDEEGVSLERISVTDPTNESSNWKSASSTAGYATPGLTNSNSIKGVISETAFSVNPEIFEPIKGQPSFAQIHYNLDKPGMIANVNVLDFEGRHIREIANNALLGTEGFFRWDGDTENGVKARTGYYIIHVELFDLEGRVITYKKRVVIASRL